MDGLDAKGFETPEAKFATPKNKLDTAAAAIADTTEDDAMNIIKKVEGGAM